MNNNTDTRRMQELVELLNRAAKAYYQDADEIMSNYEYDALYDELQAQEAQRASKRTAAESDVVIG